MGHVVADLALGVDSLTGVGARARVGVGIAPWLSAGAEAFAVKAPGAPVDFGALAGITARW